MEQFTYKLKDIINQYTHQLNEYIFSEEHITVNNLNIHMRVKIRSMNESEDMQPVTKPSLVLNYLFIAVVNLSKERI